MKWVFYLVEPQTHARSDSGAKVYDFKPFYIRTKVKVSHEFFLGERILMGTRHSNWGNKHKVSFGCDDNKAVLQGQACLLVLTPKF
ncbi:MAG: hypothetical protein SWZ49_33185 [Cyanobacteriota bacterium]|nr:hypothetical protein [Cyanobacteriota bacterium]